MATTRPTSTRPTGTRLTPLTTPDAPRIILASDGQEKSGKSHFALTAPRPLAYFVLDRGFENVRAVRDGGLSTAGIDTADYTPDIDSGDPTAVAKAANAVWTPLVSDYTAALQSAHYRTVVIDTATELWELLRLARFGKLTQIMSHHYGPVNAEMRRFIRLAYKSDKNVVFIHKMRDEYINKIDKTGKEVGTKTGRLERAGFKNMGYDVQMNITHLKTGGVFEVRVDNCGLNPDVEGLPSMPMTFADLAQLVYPESDPSWWGA